MDTDVRHRLVAQQEVVEKTAVAKIGDWKGPCSRAAKICWAREFEEREDQLSFKSQFDCECQRLLGASIFSRPMSITSSR
jgi:hypothetical protein